MSIDFYLKATRISFTKKGKKVEQSELISVQFVPQEIYLNKEQEEIEKSLVEWFKTETVLAKTDIEPMMECYSDVTPEQYLKIRNNNFFQGEIYNINGIEPYYSIKQVIYSNDPNFSEFLEQHELDPNDLVNGYIVFSLDYLKGFNRICEALIEDEWELEFVYY